MKLFYHLYNCLHREEKYQSEQANSDVNCEVNPAFNTFKSSRRLIWDKVVDTLHQHHTNQANRDASPNIYHEEVDQKWKNLIVFFNKCQTYVGIMGSAVRIRRTSSDIGHDYRQPSVSI